MDDIVEKEISSDVTLKIIDMILVNETSLNKATVREKFDDRLYGCGGFLYSLTDFVVTTWTGMSYLTIS